MTKKRFTIDKDGITIIDNCTDGLTECKHSNEAYLLCNFLNEQHEEIEKLEIKVEDTKLELENIKEHNDEAHYELYQTKKENEQLKDKIDVLEDDNEKYHKSLEQLNLYTKRFIPTKCTNEFKDCKTNRYYWLDHEGNFEGCLELLNLLDYENKLLKSENRQLKGKLMVYEEQIKGDIE